MLTLLEVMRYYLSLWIRDLLEINTVTQASIAYELGIRKSEDTTLNLYKFLFAIFIRILLCYKI